MPVYGLSSAPLPVTTAAHFDIERVIRPNILSLHPYRCARDDYKAGVLLDANENALGHSIPRGDVSSEHILSALALNLNRYPDPSHDEIKERIAALRGVAGKDYVFLGVGSDEVIDLLMRVCVIPAQETVLITPPTYGMYAVCAQVNDARVVKVPLELSGEAGEGGEQGRFSLRVDDVKKAVDADSSIKLIFLCSPGNPTGTLISLSSIRALLDYRNFKGIVVVDEAYIDFSGDANSAVSLVKEYPNICVLQTLSKSFGLAAIRLGVAIAQPPLVQVLSNAKAPYNITTPSAHLAFSALSPAAVASMHAKRDTLVASRGKLLVELAALAHLGLGEPIGKNDANFVLIPVLTRDGSRPDNVRSQKVYRTLADEHGIIVRFRGNELGCEACLRITVGTEIENETALTKLKEVLTTS